MPVGNILKLNFYVIGVEDEQFGRIAALRYLSTGAALLGERAHNAFSIEILNRHAVTEETGLSAACDRHQSKELRTCADPKYDAFAMPNRGAKQPLVEGCGALQVRNSDPRNFCNAPISPDGCHPPRPLVGVNAGPRCRYAGRPVIHSRHFLRSDELGVTLLEIADGAAQIADLITKLTFWPGVVNFTF
jgi:hypothetical protein